MQDGTVGPMHFRNNVGHLCRQLDVVELFATHLFHCETVVNQLRSCADLERIRQKVN